MYQKLLIPLLLLALLCGCSASLEETATAVPTEELAEIGTSSYYCTTEELHEPTGNEGVVSTVFKHSIYDPEHDYIAKLAVTVTGSHSPEEGTASISSISAKLSEEAAEGLTVSEHLSGDTGTVILYRNQMSVCHFQYRLSSEGNIKFLNSPAQEQSSPAFQADEAVLEQLALDFIAWKEADFQSEEHLSLAEFYAPEVRDTLEEQVSWKVFRFEKLVRMGMLDDILWEEFNASVNNIDISGDTAVVDAFESYEYELSAAEGKISGRGTSITFSCQKIGDKWFITEIDTDNELIEGHVAGYSADELPALAGVSE